MCWSSGPVGSAGGTGPTADISLSPAYLSGQEQETVTDHLVHRFHRHFYQKEDREFAFSISDYHVPNFHEPEFCAYKQN